MYRFVAAIFIGLLLGNAVHAQSTAWLDVALDGEGRATEAVVVGDTHPVLADHIRAWAQSHSFTAATVDGQAVASTTSIWVSYTLVEVEDGLELQVLDYHSSPRVIFDPAPQYPRNALLAGQEGWVQVRFTVRPDGTVSDPKVVESSSKVFAKEALRAVKQWRFKPDTVNGQPVSTEAERTVKFELE